MLPKAQLTNCLLNQENGRGTICAQTTQKNLDVLCFQKGDAASSPDSGQDSQATPAVEKENQSLDDDGEEQKAQWDLTLLQPMSSEMAIRQVCRRND